MSETFRFLVGVGCLCLVPGWLWTHPFRALVSRGERVVLAIALGGLGSAIVHLRWNTWFESLDAAPSGAVVLRGMAVACAAIVGGLALRAARSPRVAGPTRGSRRAAALLCLATLSPLPVVALLVAPNGRLSETHVDNTQDEVLHYVLVGEFLRPGPVEVPWLAGYPMPPYEFLAAASQASFVRAVGSDPLLLAQRAFPAGLLMLGSALAFLVVRRFTGSDLAGLLGAASLVWAGDVGNPALLVSQLHSGMAYVACVAGVLLLHIGLEDDGLDDDGLDDEAPHRARSWALVAAAFALGSIFQLKTTLFVTLAFAMMVTAAWRYFAHRRLDLFCTGMVMAAVMVALGVEYVQAAVASPLRFAPGFAYAHMLSELPAPWGEVLSPRPVALVLGLAIALLLALNLKLVALPWARRRWRDGARPAPAGVFLACSVGVGAGLMVSVYPPAHPGSLVPYWFLQHPLLLAGQILFGGAMAAWLGAGGRWARGRAVLLALPGLLAVAALPSMLGDDPMQLPIAEYHCGRWLLAHSAPTDVVLVAQSSIGIPIYSLRPVDYVHVPIFAGDKANEIAPPDFLEGILAEASSRRARLGEIFSSDDPARVRALIAETGARYLYVGSYPSLAMEPAEVFGAPVHSCDGGGMVFELRE